MGNQTKSHIDSK